MTEGGAWSTERVVRHTDNSMDKGLEPGAGGARPFRPGWRIRRGRAGYGVWSVLAVWAATERSAAAWWKTVGLVGLLALAVETAPAAPGDVLTVRGLTVRREWNPDGSPIRVPDAEALEVTNRFELQVSNMVWSLKTWFNPTTSEHCVFDGRYSYYVLYAPPLLHPQTGVPLPGAAIADRHFQPVFAYPTSRLVWLAYAHAATQERVLKEGFMVPWGVKSNLGSGSHELEVRARNPWGFLAVADILWSWDKWLAEANLKHLETNSTPFAPGDTNGQYEVLAWTNLGPVELPLRFRLHRYARTERDRVRYLASEVLGLAESVSLSVSPLDLPQLPRAACIWDHRHATDKMPYLYTAYVVSNGAWLPADDPGVLSLVAVARSNYPRFLRELFPEPTPAGHGRAARRLGAALFLLAVLPPGLLLARFAVRRWRGAKP